MSTRSTTRCEYCESEGESVATRPGRGAQALCDSCDAWISERMRDVNVVVPENTDSVGDRSTVDPEAGRTLALDPELSAVQALEFAGGISFEAIGQLEAAGFETVDDLWQADRDELIGVPHVTNSDVDTIVETISTAPNGEDDDGFVLR